MKYFCNTGAVLSVALALWLGYKGDAIAMGISVALAFGLLFFANIDKIARLKAGASGFEAETKDVINEAKQVTTELRDLANILIENQITNLIRLVGSCKPEEQEQRKNELLDVLKKIDDSPNIEASLFHWHRFTCRDYAYAILNGRGAPSPFGGETWESYRKLVCRSIDEIAGPDEIEQFLKKYNLLTTERKEQVEDYRYYREHKKHRRIDQWYKHESWTLSDK